MKSYSLLLLFFLILGNSIAQPAFSKKLKFKKLADLPKPVYGMVAATDGENIFSIGGGNIFLPYSNDILIYHISKNEWSVSDAGKDWTPFSFGWGSYLPQLKKIIFMGGAAHGTRTQHGITQVLFEHIYILDAKAQTYKIMTPNIHSAVDAGVATWENQLYVFGGSVAAKNNRTHIGYTNAFHRFDPATGKWAKLPLMPDAKIVKGEIVNGMLYTFGGKADALKKEIHEFDIKLKKWEKIGELEQPLASFSTAIYKNKIILVGGGNLMNNIIQVFNTKTKGIFTIKTNLPSKNSGAVVVDGMLYVFGGNDNGSASNELWVLDLKKIKLFNM